MIAKSDIRKLLNVLGFFSAIGAVDIVRISLMPLTILAAPAISRIAGIEKEYRLSKVSKVSAFMYGHDETLIVYSDALQSHPMVEDGRYRIAGLCSE